MTYGVKLEAMPLRIYDYDVVCGSSQSAVDYPEEFELERAATVKDQGDVSGCAACAFATILEHIFGIEMSEGFIYSYLRADTDKNPGMYVTRLLELAVKASSVPLSDFGVWLEMPEIRQLILKLAELVGSAEKYRIGGFANLNYANAAKKDSAIKHALLTNKTDDGKSIPILAVSQNYFSEPHAIVLRGWNDKNNTYKIQNSWGEEWEDNGYGEIPKDEIDAAFAIFAKGITFPFTDVKESDWYFDDIKNMYFSGLIKGVGNNTFEPERGVTRGEFAAVLNRHCKQDDENHRLIYKVLNELNELRKELRK